MNKRILPGIGFVLLGTFVCFFLGLAIGGFITPKNSGLAGGAIVFGYGVMGGVIGLIGSIWGAVKLSFPRLKQGLMIAGVLTLLAGGWIGYRFYEKNAGAADSVPVTPKREVTEPVAP